MVLICEDAKVQLVMTYKLRKNAKVILRVLFVAVALSLSVKKCNSAYFDNSEYA